MRSLSVLILLFISFVFGCKPESKTTFSEPEEKISGTNPLLQAIQKHGGDLFDSAHYAFEFRGATFTFLNAGKTYTYTKQVIKDNDTVVDHLTNNAFSRTINGIQKSLSDSEQTQYSENLNSVIYFATLPHKLTDPAVKSSFSGEQTILGKPYQLVKVAFKAENGGQDFEDEYLYWINTKESTIDYLAYNYKVNGGGVRFRKAYNRRIIEGIYFQDYVNYKAPVGTALDSLAFLLEQNKLDELSRIETEKVVSLN